MHKYFIIIYTVKSYGMSAVRILVSIWFQKFTSHEIALFLLDLVQ